MEVGPQSPDVTRHSAAAPAGKRRWYQFSMRAMLGWVAAISVLLAVAKLWVAPAARQRSVVLQIEDLKGIVGYRDPPRDECAPSAAVHERLVR